MRLKEYLNESINTKNISNNDILMIYNIIKKYIDFIHKPLSDKNYILLHKNIKKILSIKNIKKIKGSNEEFIYIDKINSKNLKSDICKKAHSIKPIDIYIGFPSGSSSYQANFNHIIVGISINVLNMIDKNVEDYIDKGWYNEIHTNISPRYIQQTIIHELSHWLDDALHNKHFTKRDELWIKNNPDKEYDTKHMYKKIKWEESKTEIEALVSEIELLRRTFTDYEWDNITFDEMINILKGAYSSIIIENEKTRKMILKRLYREKLLGKKMK